ncbi:MAG TPA: MarR family transcriptional regulator [Thermodesulfobacteriota bacterium]
MATKVSDLRPRATARPPAGHEYRLFDNLIFKVHRLASSYFKSASRYYQRHFDMGIPEVRLLNVVGHYEPLGSCDVVEHSSMDKAMVSRALATLIRRGLIRRAKDPSDSRRIVLTLTESGRAVWKRILVAKRARHARSIACLSAEETSQVYELLDRLYDAAEAMRQEELRAADDAP